MNETKSQGLSAAEVAGRVQRGQVNRVRRSDWADYRAILARNVATLFNALVVPAAVALFWLQEYRGAAAVSGMAVLNTLLGLVQEVRAKRHLDKLAILAETKARVLREGAEQAVPSGDVVLDDLVCLTAGEPIVADGTVVEARSLEVDEALLTGESDPVARREGEPLLSGSFCVAGDGLYRVTKVGAEAFANQTALEARQYRYAASPLQRTINRLIAILTYTAVGLCGLYFLLDLWRDFTEAELVKMVAATITSMVPQGLVLMTTLAFTLGAVRMTGRGAVVQRLGSVESMAAVNVLCMDKTGTLTTNRLRLARLRGLGGAPPEDEVRDRLRRFAWTSVDDKNKSIQALRAALGKSPGAAAGRVDQLPFKSQNRYSAVRLRTGEAEQVLVLGACEALRGFLKGPGADGWEAAWKELLPTGLRLLLFAEALAESLDGLPPFAGVLPDLALRPLALVALSDEVRPEAGAVLEALAGQGIAFKIISGDNPETVRATVGHLDLPLAREPVVSGDQLAAAGDPAGLIDDRSVFGRVAPRQKVQIVAALQARGRHVAMIGDGVNDVLPIKRADLGIAMGEGSPASKTVAGLVLENNNFELLPATLEEGRTILRNLRRAGKLFLLKNVYMLVLIVGSLLVFRLDFPVEPQQVTLLNGLTIGVPAFLFTVGRGRAGRAARAGYLREVGGFALVTGVVIGGAGLTMFRLAAGAYPDDVQTQRTLLLSTLVLLGLATLLRVLRHGEAGPGRGDAVFYGWVAFAVVLYALTMYWPLVGGWFFELTPLTAAQWGTVLAVAAPAHLACVAADWWGERLAASRGRARGAPRSPPAHG